MPWLIYIVNKRPTVTVTSILTHISFIKSLSLMTGAQEAGRLLRTGGCLTLNAPIATKSSSFLVC